jgi:PAS domain S-box-containing protein
MTPYLVPIGAVAVVAAATAAALALAVRAQRNRRREAEAALRRRDREQEALLRLAAAMLTSDGFDRLLQGVAEGITQALPAERCLILQRSPDGRLAACAGVGWPPGALAGLSLPPGDPAAAALLSAGSSPRAQTFDDVPGLRAAGVPAGTAMGAAIRGRSALWGAILVLAGGRRRFEDDERRFLDAAALTLGSAIARVEERGVLEDQEARLRAVWEQTVDGLAVLDESGGIERVNPAAERMFGRAEHELVGSSLDQLVDEAAPGGSGARMPGATGAVAGPARDRRVEARGRRGDGTAFPLDLSMGEIVLEGRRHFIAAMRDLTDRRDTEEQLRQAQKMEAVGELTGGVAHDFNNLLTVVLGNAELLVEELARWPRLQALAETTRDAAQRGAELTRRLLAFSRRQALQPVALDLNRLVLDVEKLLRRTLGEHIDIETVLHAGLWKVYADPGQLEAALVNLALNARDAMAGSGKLTIETANARLDDHYAAAHVEVTPGQYVAATVTDTGTGMTAEVRDRAFEPFFTTKEVGKGTGLGLSMVYGFVKQSGGHVKIYSEVGQGTAVKIYLPRAPLTASAPPPPPAGFERLAAGRESVLVAEDDPMVRAYVSEQLRGLGYAVHEAEDGAAALRVLGELGRVDLLLSDVVMPGGMDGRHLAERAQAIQPGLKVLYTSGYTENAIIHHGRLDPGVQLLSKPFRKAELARKVRAVLDS